MDNENTVALQKEFSDIVTSSAQEPMEKASPISATLHDALFAIAALILGYMFVRLPFLSYRYVWLTAVFTAVYLASVGGYFWSKGQRFDASTWFWFGATFVSGLSLSIHSAGGSFATVRVLFWFLSAGYWTVCASGARIEGRTGNLLPYDMMNGLIVLPFGNFANIFRGFGYFFRRGNRRARLLPTVLGLCFAVLLISIVAPLLETADGGRFAASLNALRQWISTSRFGNDLAYLIPATPAAMYIYGLASGGIHRRRANVFRAEKIRLAGETVRIVDPLSVCVMLGIVCGVYLLFVVCQLPDFFSAFLGVRAADQVTHAANVREGFSELCGVATINLTVLALATLFTKKSHTDSEAGTSTVSAVRVLRVALSVVTLLLIVTAFSKLALYVGIYGMTENRLMSFIMMLWLAVVFVATIVLQRKRFSLVRFGAAAMAAALILVCAIGSANICRMYNENFWTEIVEVLPSDARFVA